MGQSAAVAFFKGQAFGMKGRIDATHFLQQEQEHLENISRLSSDSRTRPSILLPFLESGGWTLGVAAACAPSNVSQVSFMSRAFSRVQWNNLCCKFQVSLAIAGALQDAIAEQYNDHIRDLRESGDLEKVRAHHFKTHLGKGRGFRVLLSSVIYRWSPLRLPFYN